MEGNVIGIVIEAISLIILPHNISALIIGVLIGFYIGVIPGIGGDVTLALLIPVTYGYDPVTAFILMTAALGGINQGASITAILLNTPGAPPNAATILDGYPMTRNGEAGRAIGAAATSSALGSIVGVLALLFSLPLLLRVVLSFGAPEIFWLALWGLTIIAVVVKGSIVTGLISACLGAVFALHGMNSMTSTVRWSYGQTFMIDGFPIVPAMIGMFAVGEMMRLATEGQSIQKKSVTFKSDMSDRVTGIKDVLVHRYLFIRSAAIGVVVGVIPGIGGIAANFIAYYQAVQTTSDSGNYGNGDVRGVIASEASNDAKDGGGFIPTLALGIPGSVSMAILLGAFLLHGIAPGPNILINHLDIVGVIIVSLFLSNLMSSTLALLMANQFSRVARINVHTIIPVVLVIAFLGAYAVRGNVYDFAIVLLFGILGFTMVKIDMSRVPLILAIVLVPLVEVNFFRSLQISQNDYTVFVRGPIAISLMVLIVVSLFLPMIKPRVEDRLPSYGGSDEPQ